MVLPRKYTLRCRKCGAEYEPSPGRLVCDRDHAPALLFASYTQKHLEVKNNLPGLFRFIDWLPVENTLDVEGKPITYESKKLAHHLGLKNLFISFNGYWPERNARLLTCSFKELEAPVVLARRDGVPGRIVVASAGNTGRAFCYICSRTQFPLCLVLPEQNLSALWLPTTGDTNSICLVAASGSCDYYDAIHLAKHIGDLPGCFPEGGASNVARRDGMGVTVLDAAVELGRIPDHYFQAVGSGTGGIAAWEANLRLLEDGRFGGRRMQLHLAQNQPFTPMTDAWKARSPSISPLSETDAKTSISQVSAKVLSNRQPAYALSGGLYDALIDSNGEMYAVSNQESDQARALFQTLEGIDISPAAGVATASLLQAVDGGLVGPQDYILLNITSGGYQRLQQDFQLQSLKPDIAFANEDILPDRVATGMKILLQSTHSSVAKKP
ncbi:MAG: cysteate synthase [Hormoscilla sp.]